MPRIGRRTKGFIISMALLVLALILIALDIDSERTYIIVLSVIAILNLGWWWR